MKAKMATASGGHSPPDLLLPETPYSNQPPLTLLPQIKEKPVHIALIHEIYALISLTQDIAQVIVCISQ